MIEATRITREMLREPRHPLDLADETGESVIAVIRALANMEVQGTAARRPDGYWTVAK